MNTGLYKKVPLIFIRLIDRLFDPEAGFESRKLDGSKIFARDMTLCPYHETYKHYSCTELTQFFCKSDDITYGNMHLKLIWARTQTIEIEGRLLRFQPVS